MKEVQAWVRGGGRILAIERAIGSFADKDGFSLKRNSEDDKEDNRFLGRYGVGADSRDGGRGTDSPGCLRAN